MNTSYGANPDKFGHADYFQQLKGIWDTSDPGADRQRKLAQKRQDVLAWMKDPGNVDKIGKGGAPGQEGGLFSQISSGELTHKFGPSAGTWEKIGHADLMAGRAAGHSWGDFKSYLDQNLDRLGPGNVKGAGGLYDQVAGEARFEQTTRENNQNWSDLISNMQTSFDDSLAQQQDFQRAQLDWQSTESQAQRDHEAAMLAEQRKVKTATPTHVKNPISQLAIGPGKVAAPQSASSLARKRLGAAPLVTGLNIGSKKTSMNIK